MIEQLFPNVDWGKMIEATYETLYMTAIATVITFALGIIIGIVLFLTSDNQLWANKVAHFLTGSIVNIFRSIPFIVLIILLIPFTKFLLGTIRGANAALPALIILVPGFDEVLDMVLVTKFSFSSRKVMK